MPKEDRLLERGRCFPGIPECNNPTAFVWEWHENGKFYIVEFCRSCYYLARPVIAMRGHVKELRGVERDEDRLDFDPYNQLNKESDIHHI